MESELPFECVHAAYAHTHILKLHKGTSTAMWPLQSELMFMHFKWEKDHKSGLNWPWTMSRLVYWQCSRHAFRSDWPYWQIFLEFSSFSPYTHKFWDSTSFRLQSLPSKSFIIYHSPITLPLTLKILKYWHLKLV